MTDKGLSDEAIVKGLDGADVFLRDLAGSTNTSLDEYAIGILFNIAYLCGDAADLINRQKAELLKEKNKNSKLRNERNRLKAEIEQLGMDLEVARYNLGERMEELNSAEYEITRQKAEIERLVKKDNEWALSYANAVARGIIKREEAIKEFVERLKKELSLIKKECRKYLENDGVFAIDKARKKVDNIAKEMVGDN